MRDKPKNGEVYKHFKGNYYRVITIAHHSETNEELVIYQALYGENKICARPLDMFMSPVDHEKYPEVKQADRFELLEMPGDISSLSDREMSLISDAMQAATAAAQDTEAQKTEPEFHMHTPDQQIHPIVLEYLEAETYDAKLKVIDAHHSELNEHMLITMAVAIDCDLKGATLYEQIDELRYCLMTKKHFEVDRFGRRS